MDEFIITRACEDDIPDLDRLLYQVHKVHSDVRPDIFKVGSKKYTDDELKEIIKNDTTPIFVYKRVSNGNLSPVLGYAFCIHKQLIGDNNMTDIKTLYIDDLCVDETARGAHIGTKLYEYVIDYARASGCYNLTLNVWADNEGALAFYKKIGLKTQKIGMEKIL